MMCVFFTLMKSPYGPLSLTYGSFVFKKGMIIMKMICFIMLNALLGLYAWSGTAEQVQAEQSLAQDVETSSIISEQEQAEEEQEEAQPNLISLGEFTATYYCTEPYQHICNAGLPLRTASGSEPTPYYTIAVDPDVIPLGSFVWIDGKQYLAEDTGSVIKGNKIDICVAEHQEALGLGVKRVEVFAAEHIN